jgi:transcriptional regulator
VERGEAKRYKSAIFTAMYQMPYFSEEDREQVLLFMAANPFVTLIGNHDGINAVTQVPVMVFEKDGAIVIRGHIMRNTDHHLAFKKNKEVLALFTGANSYVSASWYSERGHGSTWNYMTVHARGTIALFENEETIAILKELTHVYEDQQEKPELLENMSKEYVDTFVKAITGFEIVVHSLHPIFKLSQNRDDESYRHIVSKLEAAGNANATAIAWEMKKRRK